MNIAIIYTLAMQIIIFGGGMQGRVIAQNLLERQEKPNVIIADLNKPASMPAGAKFVACDVLQEKQVKTAVAGCDSAVLAVPSEISHEALSNLIKTGIATVDVSFTPEPPLSLHQAAVANGACCVVDCGVAPGLSHILAASAYAELGGLDFVRILVGGMPQKPTKGFHHAIYFNPHDLVSEYIRPARARKNGADIQPNPMDYPFDEYVDAELGALQLFLSDGLRTLLTSFPDVPDMAELTIRWTGHLQTMKLLDEIGCFKDAATTKALGNLFGKQYPAEEFPDVLLMVVEAGKGKEKRSWRLIDRKVGEQSAMSRTTGYTTAAVAMLLAKKVFTEPGVHPPEHLGKNPDIAKMVIADLLERGVTVTDTTVAQLSKQA
ncbi:MAG: saccharopine dehydrogenase C-terminal domain-containing protein [Candidatus Obscuribacterales bacterium]|nr:saccharopine dehydrogenase C-terminal domain-containing protein [Candidatus Obscuribacterales bacterium]